jgi:hypothetical protein
MTGDELQRKLADAIEEAIDHGVRAFSGGLSAMLVGRTITAAEGEVWSSEGEWEFTLTLDDGSVLVGQLGTARGPVAELVRMAGGNPYGSDEQEQLDSGGSES